MAIPTTNVQILNLLIQAMQNLNGLQRDMNANATAWKAQAVAQSVPLATLAGFMNTAATSYQTRLGWLVTAQANTTLWAQLGAMWTKLGATQADFDNLVTPLTAVANQLGPADKSSYAAISTACDSILAAVNAPVSLWPQ
jgi:hypothetical protein